MNRLTHKTKKTVAVNGTLFAVIIHAEPHGGFWAECPSFTGCYSQGETVSSVLKNISKAIRLCSKSIVVSRPKKERSRLIPA